MQFVQEITDRDKQPPFLKTQRHINANPTSNTLMVQEIAIWTPCFSSRLVRLPRLQHPNLVQFVKDKFDPSKPAHTQALRLHQSSHENKKHTHVFIVMSNASIKLQDSVMLILLYRTYVCLLTIISSMQNFNMLKCVPLHR